MPIRILMDDDTQIEAPWMIRKPGVTEAEFMRLAGEDDRWELIDGELIVHSPAEGPHEDLVAWLLCLARDFVELKGLGKVYPSNRLIHLGSCRKLAPDVSFLSIARMHQDLKKWVEAPCNWVCEVASPSSLGYDLGEKRDLYKEHGFDEIWVANPFAQRLHVSVRRGRRYEERVFTRGRVASLGIPGFWVQVGWLWRRPMGLSCLRTLVGRDALIRGIDEAGEE